MNGWIALGIALLLAWRSAAGRRHPPERRYLISRVGLCAHAAPT
jgi:hypothetical protein